MPTPIGHALGGLIVGLLAAGGAGGAGGARRAGVTGGAGRLGGVVAFTTIAACLPDVDFLWGRHNMETHSLGFAALVGTAAYAAARAPFILRRWPSVSASSPSRLATLSALAVASHVLFDWLGSDDFPPLGVMALWPVSHDFYFANAFVFEAISRRYWLPGFVAHNLLAVLREVAILSPLLAVAWWRVRQQSLER